MVQSFRICTMSSPNNQERGYPVGALSSFCLVDYAQLNLNLESGLPVKTLLGHAFLTILTPYIHTRIKTRAPSHGWPDAPSSDYRRKLWKILNTAESLHSLLGLLNFVVFLSNGRYVSVVDLHKFSAALIHYCRYRTLSDRLLSMRLAPTRQLSNRAVSYEFMNRQMVWHAFTVRISSTGFSV